jgi:hypothetical protein
MNRPKRAASAVLILSAAILPVVGGAASSGEPSRATPPDLRPLAPIEVIGPTTGFMMTLGVDAPMVVDGCFANERIRKGAERCLRFDGIVANSGKGALELAYEIDTSEGLAAAYQRVFNSDGSFEDRFATTSEYHPTHLHFHVSDFYVARLWSSNERGRKRGAAPVATGDKNGFCPEDSEPIIEAEDQRRHYSCFSEDERGLSASQVVGISAGWVDIYSADLPDQFVEISGVPDGHYALEIEIDPNDVFEEADEDNNTVCVVLKLEGTTASLLDPMPACKPSHRALTP